MAGGGAVAGGAAGPGKNMQTCPTVHVSFLSCSKQCLKKFDVADIEMNRLNLMEMERNKADLLILGLLESLRYSDETN